LAEALDDDLGVCFSQISFVPDLEHTYLTLETVLAVPTLVHLVPAIVALEVDLTAVPLFQMSLVPDLTQKYFTPPVVLVVPTLVHLVPAIVAA
jgi:uncharacterized membrane protein YjjB (DUF3815 family)